MREQEEFGGIYKLKAWELQQQITETNQFQKQTSKVRGQLLFKFCHFG